MRTCTSLGQAAVGHAVALQFFLFSGDHLGRHQFLFAVFDEMPLQPEEAFVVLHGQAIRQVEVALAHAQVVDGVQQVGLAHAVLADKAGQAGRTFNLLEGIVLELGQYE